MKGKESKIERIKYFVFTLYVVLRMNETLLLCYLTLRYEMKIFRTTSIVGKFIFMQLISYVGTYSI